MKISGEATSTGHRWNPDPTAPSQPVSPEDRAMSPPWPRARSATPVVRPGTNAMFAERGTSLTTLLERLTSQLALPLAGFVHLLLGASPGTFRQNPRTSPRASEGCQRTSVRDVDSLIRAT